MFDDLLSLICAEVDPRRAFDDAWSIQAIDRHFTFTAFQESARYSAERLRRAGLSEVEVLEAPADGKSIFGDWRMPLAWDVEEAHFDLIGHNGVAQRIADRSQVPQCLAMWSGPTPPEGVEAEIVHLPNAADTKSYSPESVRGKIAFTSSHPHHVKRLLADMGAVGILSDHLHASAKGLDATAWINSFSDDPGGWALLAGDTQGWAFMIPPGLGERIRQRLAIGEEVRGRALVRSRLYEGTLPAVTGVIPGSGKEEVVLIGHQFECGAIDNAAGVAIMIEAVRVLQQLVSEGKLPAPQRSIRVLFISECYSNLYFWEKTRRHRRTVAGICFDSPVGSPDLAIRPTEIHTNPHSNMSYVDALATHLARKVMEAEPLYAWREVGFAPGTDSFIADTSFDIPCPWIGGHSRTWHTSADVPDLLPVPVMGLMAQIGAAYAYLNASADREQIIHLAHLAAARGKCHLAQAASLEMERLTAASFDLDDSMKQLAYLSDRHAEAVASVLRLLPASERAGMRAYLRPLQRELRRGGREAAAALARRAGKPGHAPAAQAPDGALASIRPRRKVLGPLALDRLTPEQRGGRPSPRWSDALFAVLSWCDGKRSIAETCALAGRELRRDHTLSPEELAKRIDPNCSSILDYFEFLRQHGYVAW